MDPSLVFRHIAAEIARVDNTTLFWMLSAIVTSFLGGVGWIISRINRTMEYCASEDKRIHDFCIAESNRLKDGKLSKDVFSEFEKHNARYHQNTQANIIDVGKKVDKLNRNLAIIEGWKELEQKGKG